MKSLLRGFVAVGVIVFAFVAAQPGNQQAVTQKTQTQIKTQAPITQAVPLLKPDFSLDIRVTLEPSITSTNLVKNFGFYTNGPAYCWMIIKNDGPGDATKVPKYQYIVWFDDKKIETVDGSVPNVLKKGESFSIRYDMPANKYGKWNFWVAVDIPSEIVEASENNNTRSHVCTCQKLI
jgi:hypothetical protein